jgi:serine/threonine protein kinase
MFEKNNIISDRYTLIRLLGRGGFSEVWLANDNLTNIQVALKIYAPGMGMDEDGLTLFADEFSIVFDLNHSNLLRPTHYDSFNRQPYLVMPFCKNGSTLKLIGKMSEEQAWRLIRDVAAGLEYLHSKNPPIIHQDIKPDNILVNDEERYVITDFGISTRIRSTLRKSIKKTGNESAGTLAYMGPERFSASNHPIIASDIYSLGATVFELLDGEPPFGEQGGLIQKSGAEIPKLQGNYSKNLQYIIQKCLDVEPWNRPSAETIKKYAQDVLDGKNPHAIKISIKNKNKMALLLCAIFVLLVIVSFVVIKTNKENNENKNLANNKDIEINYTKYISMVNEGDSLLNVASLENGYYEERIIQAYKDYQIAYKLKKDFPKEKDLLNLDDKILRANDIIGQTINKLNDKANKMDNLKQYDIAEKFRKRVEKIKEINIINIK